MGSVDPNHPRDVNVTVVFVDKLKQNKKRKMQRDEDETGDKWVAVGKKDGGETVSLTQEKKLGWSKQDGVKIFFFFLSSQGSWKPSL